MSTKTFRVEWAQVAQRDLDEIADYILAENPAAALRMAESIEEKAVTLESMPSRGRVPPELLRFRLQMYRELQVPPYRLIYRIYENTVVVLGVFDGRRDLEDVILGRLLSV
ncbi:MAG: type II toxin-antitoxin system RelE/ParE family toxin [bacterium]|nr:type II toxin-antitoxin system RelE/ParE family toxin [bacterium]